LEKLAENNSITLTIINWIDWREIFQNNKSLRANVVLFVGGLEF
jgi:hypothetical protein